MQKASRLTTALLFVPAAVLVLHARAQSTSQSGAVELQLAQILFDDGRYHDALEAYQKAVRDTDEPGISIRAHMGAVESALRVADFGLARREAQQLVTARADDADARTVNADSLWAAGLFEEAEAEYRRALVLNPDQPRGHRGLARALAARNRLDEAVDEAERAVQLSPRDPEIQHTIGQIYERKRRFADAAASFERYTNLLPATDASALAIWSRAQIRFLRSFGDHEPLAVETPDADRGIYTVPFRLVNDKILVRVRVNDRRDLDFVLDTGSDYTVITPRSADRLHITPVSYTLSAGVGEKGLRGLELGRLDSFQIGALKLRNVPAIIKNPPLLDLPVEETESFSPIALGFSMIVDYKQKTLTIARHLPQEPADLELPLRVDRLATVRGVIDGVGVADFVIDTAGQVISISRDTADALGTRSNTRHIPLKVYGASGWDRDAFLLMGIDLAFDTLRYPNLPVVVLNLRAPSALLGFELGGIVGHRFLSKYRVGIDLDRSVVRLKTPA